jgi:hypothetical protein
MSLAQWMVRLLLVACQLSFLSFTLYQEVESLTAAPGPPRIEAVSLEQVDSALSGIVLDELSSKAAESPDDVRANILGENVWTPGFVRCLSICQSHSF